MPQQSRGAAEGGAVSASKARFYELSFKKAALVAAVLCLLAAFICVTIGSKSSFLYAFHDGNDANWFLTMGRGIVNGKVPYKDLFEQKGLLTYMIFALNYAICGNHMYVVYVVQVICMAAFTGLCYKTARLYISYAPALLIAVLSCLLAVCSFAYVGGAGEVEEYCLPLLKKGGALAAYKGAEAENELAGAKRAMQLLGAERCRIEETPLGEEGREHRLLVITKTKPTPSKYPRKAGTPAKEPLK